MILSLHCALHSRLAVVPPFCSLHGPSYHACRLGRASSSLIRCWMGMLLIRAGAASPLNPFGRMIRRHGVYTRTYIPIPNHRGKAKQREKGGGLPAVAGCILRTYKESLVRNPHRVLLLTSPPANRLEPMAASDGTQKSVQRHVHPRSSSSGRASQLFSSLAVGGGPD